MFSEAQIQDAARAFVPVLHLYDGLNGTVIRWTLEHGNTNPDPSVLIWVLDPQGEVIEACPSGSIYSASALRSWLDKMSQASFPLVDPAAYPELAKEAKQVASRTKLGAAMARIRQRAAEPGASEELGRQAAALLAAVEAHASWRAERARTLETSDPAAALELYKETAALFKGDAAGEAAQARLDALRKDQAFLQRIEARRLLATARALEGDTKPARHGAAKDYADAAFQAKNARQLAQIRQLLHAVIQRHAGTPEATEATGLLDAWKLR